MEITQDMRLKAINYKKNIAGKFMLVEGAKIKSRIGGEDFCVTRKIDGHLQCLFFNGEETIMLNSNGIQKAEGLACLNLFTENMKKAGVKSAMMASELYLPQDDGRPRCSDVIKALADNNLKNRLALVIFDVIEIDGVAFESAHYKEVYAKINGVLPEKSELCKPVEMRTASSIDEVQQIFEEWVENEGAEGIVVHSETHIVCKVKPRHTIDATIIGYTTTERGIRDLMFAVRHEDGLYRMFCIGSSGMTDEQRADFASRLSTRHVESQYILSDSRGIAYQMVSPEIVCEISALELVAQGNDGKVKTNPLLQYDEEKGWMLEKIAPGVSVQGITFNRERTDKQVNTTDIRVSQITDLCPFEESEESACNLEKSTLLERRVFKKVAKDKVMLHKFLIWKTNKEASGRYPAYVFFHTDYSSTRKELIKRDMIFSSNEEQIRQVLEAEIADNIKKGWEEIV